MKIADKIRCMRKMKGWSQEAMAAELGLSVTGYAKLERGETDVQWFRLETIAKALKIDVVELVTAGEHGVLHFKTAYAGPNSTIQPPSADCINAKILKELDKISYVLQEAQESLANIGRRVEQLEAAQPKERKNRGPSGNT